MVKKKKKKKKNVAANLQKPHILEMEEKDGTG